MWCGSIGRGSGSFSLRIRGRGQLWARDYFVWRFGEDELHISRGIGLQSFGNFERGQIDLLVPVAICVVVAAGVECAVGYGVVADFFGVSITKNQSRGRERWGLSGSACGGWAGEIRAH